VISSRALIARVITACAWLSPASASQAGRFSQMPLSATARRLVLAARSAPDGQVTQFLAVPAPWPGGQACLNNERRFRALWLIQLGLHTERWRSGCRGTDPLPPTTGTGRRLLAVAGHIPGNGVASARWQSPPGRPGDARLRRCGRRRCRGRCLRFCRPARKRDFRQATASARAGTKSNRKAVGWERLPERRIMAGIRWHCP
jgi:hypothetical protein